jgi:hypothetical protein
MSEPNSLPPYAARDLVSQRLPLIFPEGTPNRNYCVRDVAAYTVFTMLYIGAVEGSGRFLGPKHVYRMTDQQAAKAERGARERYGREASAFRGARWYQDNAREAVRDETLREGLIPAGAVAVRADLPTTSSKPREPDQVLILHDGAVSLSRLAALIEGAAAASAGTRP